MDGIIGWIDVALLGRDTDAVSLKLSFTKMDASPSILVGFESEMAQNLPSLAVLSKDAVITASTRRQQELEQHDEEKMISTAKSN